MILTAKQKKALERLERQETNLARIRTANNEFYRSQAADIDLTPVPPERKQAFAPTDDLKPYLKVGEFVKVENNTTAGKYRPEGYGYVQETFGVGLAAFYTIKYTPAHDGGRIHKRVHLAELTPCSPFDNTLPEDSKRARKSPDPVPELEEEVRDDRLPIQKLCDALVLGARRGKMKGWYRRTLELGNRRYLNDNEERQFKIELLMFEQHLNEPSVKQLKHDRKASARYKKTKKYRKMRVDPITLKYFVQTAWGLSSGFLCKFKARQSTTTDNANPSVDYLIDSKVKEEDDKTVIDDLVLATNTFTSSYLFAINC